MGAALAIRRDVADADELRRLARREPDRRAATRMLAIANALEGMTRAEAARLLDGYDAIVDACCQAWNALTPERLHSRTFQPWIQKVAS